MNETFEEKIISNANSLTGICNKAVDLTCAILSLKPQGDRARVQVISEVKKTFGQIKGQVKALEKRIISFIEED